MLTTQFHASDPGFYSTVALAHLVTVAGVVSAVGAALHFWGILTAVMTKDALLWFNQVGRQR
jgi:hypothetical protein